jgi:hypothetical protein
MMGGAHFCHCNCQGCKSKQKKKKLLVSNMYGDMTLFVLNPCKGVCADPVERGTILEVEGPGPPNGDSERQLSPDRGGGKM